METLAAYAAWAVSSRDVPVTPRLTLLCVDGPRATQNKDGITLQAKELVSPQESFPVNRMTRHVWDNF